jgi:hypothetical protein
MSRTHYIVISLLILGFIFHVARRLVKRANHRKLSSPAIPLADSGYLNDDFICIMKADSSTITTCSGMVVIGSRTKK